MLTQLLAEHSSKSKQGAQPAATERLSVPGQRRIQRRIYSSLSYHKSAVALQAMYYCSSDRTSCLVRPCCRGTATHGMDTTDIGGG